MIYQKSKAKKIVADKADVNDIVRNTIHDMANIVSATLGPAGRPVLIERDNLPILVTKDGVTVAKALGVADAAANAVIDAAKEICLNTAKEAGDGTTTAIVLASALVKSGQSFLESRSKYNPQKFARELNEAYRDVIVPMIERVSRPTNTREELLQVATISANGDTEIAEAVVEAIMASGEDGTVMIEENQGRDTRIETVEGYVITTGLKDIGQQIGPAFINDKANQQVKLDNCIVFLYNGSLNDMTVPGKIQDVVTGGSDQYNGTPIIVVAHGFADIVLDEFAKYSKRGLFIIPVKTPRSGLPNGASMFLDDLSAYTGAVVLDPGTLSDADPSDVGHCTSFKMNMYETFMMSDSDPDALSSRIEELKAIEQAAFSEFDKAFIRAAIAKLTGGISTIWVGGMSDLEIREKKARVEDAVEAVRSAIAEGIVPGACVLHLMISDWLRTNPKYESWSAIAEALLEPFKRLLENCGENPEEIGDELVINAGEWPSKVFDANNHTFVDPVEAGIIEPAKVVRVSVGNAISVAAMLITLGGIVVVPRDAGLETQMELANAAFKNMMETANE